MSLDEVGRKFNTDKASTYESGGRVRRGHDYLRHYEALLSLRQSQPEVILDLGVGSPKDAFASALMWREFFPKARIVAVDIAAREVPHGSGIEFLQTDLGNPRNLLELAQLGADLIVDDASHIWEHQLASLTYLLPSIPSGGQFIMEDLHTSSAALGEKLGSPGCPNPASLLGWLSARKLSNGPLSDEHEPSLAVMNPPGFTFWLNQIGPLIDRITIFTSAAVIQVV